MNCFRMATFWMIILLAGCGGSSTSATSQASDNSGNQINSNQMGGAIQTNLTSFSQTVTTIAGVVPGSTDGTGSAARFKSPMSITSDGTNIYVADSDNNTIRKIVIATGAVTTLAGTAGATGSNNGIGSEARFNYPLGITTDGTNLYVSDTSNCTIRKIVISTGDVSTIAGTAGVFGASADGTGPAARFNTPEGITTDGTNLYVVEPFNSLIRKVVIATGEVTTLAGTPGTYDSVDATGTAAHFNTPIGITTDGTNLFIADTGNNTIRKIVIATKEVTTLAGTAGAYGTIDGTGTAAWFSSPTGIVTDGADLFVADSNGQTIRKITIATRAVTTIAGMGGNYGSDDAIGSAARFNLPWGITANGTDIFVADSGNNTIRKISKNTNSVTTLAGYSPMGSNDGTGVVARFALPQGITTDGTNLYIADTMNCTIRKVVIATGEVTTFAGSAKACGSSDGTGTSAHFNSPVGVTTDGLNLYVTDSNYNTIKKIVISTGVVSTLAGGMYSGSNDGVGTSARFYSPRGITTDGTNLYVIDYYNHTIRKIVINTGVVSTVAGTVEVAGSLDGIGTAAQFRYPTGITTDGVNLYVADTFNSTIRKINIATREVSTFAGVAGVDGSVDGAGAASRFERPTSITTDGTNLYVGDNSTIRKIVISTAATTTIAGTAGISGYSDGVGTQARFHAWSGAVTTDGTSLFVADTWNNTIRRIQ